MSAPVVTLGTLARDMHACEGDLLVIEVPHDIHIDLAEATGVTVQDGYLRFDTPAARNRVVADEVLRELGPEGVGDGKKLFAAADRLWGNEIGHADTASGRLLAAASQQFDVLHLAVGLITGPHDVFDVLHCVEAMLPHAGALPLPSLIALVEAQHPHTVRDMAGGVFFGVIQTWLTARPAVAEELVAILLSRPRDSTASLLGAAWMAWGAHDPAAATASVVQAAAGPPPLNAVTLWVAGRMLGEPNWPADASAALEALILQRLPSSDQSVQNASIAAASGLLHLRRGFDDPLRQLANERNQEALAGIAAALARHKAAFFANGLFFQWLPLCQHLGTQYADSLGRLDFALAALLVHDSTHRDATLDFLGAWILAQPAAGAKDTRFCDQFDQCASKVVANAALLARVLTEWFLRDRRELAAAAASLLSRVRRRGTQVVAFEPGMLTEASGRELRYLARRVLGFVIDGPQQLSLAVSLLGVQDAKRRIHPLMPWLLGQEIGYDYPGLTIGRLSEAAGAAGDEETRALLNGIRAQLETYMAQLDQLPRLKELTPPASLRRELHKARAKMTQQALRDAQSKSVMNLISSQVHLKAGSGSFQYFEGKYTDTMQLKPISYEIELPRRETLDPVGNSYRLLKHRSATKDDDA